MEKFGKLLGMRGALDSACVVRKLKICRSQEWKQTKRVCEDMDSEHWATSMHLHAY